MIYSFVDLLGFFVKSDLMTALIIPILCLAFLATVPFIMRAFFGR